MMSDIRVHVASIGNDRKIYAWSIYKKHFMEFISVRKALNLDIATIDMTSTAYNEFRNRNFTSEIIYIEMMVKKTKNKQGWDNTNDHAILSTDRESTIVYYDCKSEILNMVHDMLVPSEIFRCDIKNCLDEIGYSYIGGHSEMFTDDDISNIASRIETASGTQISITFDMVALLSNYITNHFKIDNIIGGGA